MLEKLLSQTYRVLPRQAMSSRDGTTSLHGAARYGHRDAVPELLVHGAYVDAAADDSSASLRHEPVQPTLDLLLQSRNVLLLEDNSSPLHLVAADMVYEEVVKVAVAAGADVGAANAQGWTSLHLAVHKDRKGNVVQLFSAERTRILPPQTE